MKNAFLIVLVVIIVAVFIVGSIVYFAVGNIIDFSSEDAGSYDTDEQGLEEEETYEDYYETHRLVLNGPFNVERIGVNPGEEYGIIAIGLISNVKDYTMHEIEVSGCGQKEFINRDIFVGFESLFNIDCETTLSNDFKGDVTITYSEKDSSLKLTATGSIAPK